MRPQPPGPQTGFQPTVLVVDDDRAVVEIVEIALRLAGMRVLGASDPREGVRIAAREAWDIALVDVDMPVLDGWRTLRALKTTASRPVIMMSALASPGEACHRGADAFLAKPFSIVDLVATIRRCAALA